MATITKTCYILDLLYPSKSSCNKENFMVVCTTKERKNDTVKVYARTSKSCQEDTTLSC